MILAKSGSSAGGAMSSSARRWWSNFAISATTTTPGPLPARSRGGWEGPAHERLAAISQPASKCEKAERC